MLLKRTLLTAGLVTLMAISGQNLAMAGGGHGGGHGSFHGGNMSGNVARPTFNVQPQVTKSLGSGMPQQTFKTQQFQVNPTNTLLQTGKLSHVQTPHNIHLPTNVNLGQHQTKVDPLLKVNHLLDANSNQAMKGVKIPGLNVGQVTPNFPIKPIKPIKPLPPICPPYGGGKCGTGGCWGNGCGFGWNGGCGNWVFGNCGCGYWPGYFGNCGYYPYPVYTPVYTPTYFCSTPVVVPTSTTIVLNDTAVPPAPSATPVSSREIDLAVKEVRVVEAATTSQGALYRITIINKGPMNLDVATRVAALGIKESRPTNDTPRAIETLKGLKVGESADLDLRMPVAANDLPRLLVAVEIPDNFKDTDEANNVAAGEVNQLPQLAAVAQ